MKYDFSEMLKNKGLKVTNPRIAVLDAFPSTCVPMSADDIQAKVGASANEVTVYRTLAQLEAVGIVKRVDLRKQSAYYELQGSHHHHHLVCTVCGTVEPFESCDIATVSRAALSKSKKFSSIQDHSLELFGICDRCAKK